MADFDVCYDFMMDNEDEARKCASVPDPVEPKLNPAMTEQERDAEIARAKGARAISGINSYYYPEDFATINSITDLDLRRSAVKGFYRREFWNHWYDQTGSNEKAKRIYDCGVNNGPGTAVRIAQQAVNRISTPTITEDGGWGPVTIEAVNRCDDTAFVPAFQEARVDRYDAIYAKNPNVPIGVWRARARK